MMNIWSKVQRGEPFTVNEAAMAFWGVDVSSYVKPKSGRNLKRFRRERTGHDGTALFTIEAIQKLIIPIVNRQVYDKDAGEPKDGCGIIYYCSPIIHGSTTTMGEFNGGWTGPMLRETFYMRYTSEFIYDDHTP